MDTYEEYSQGALLNNRYKKVEDISEGSYGLVSLAKDTFSKSSSSNLVAVKFIYPVDYNPSKARNVHENAPSSSSSVTSSSRMMSTESTSSSRASSNAENKNVKNKKVEESKSAVLRTLRDEAFKEIRIHDILGIHPNIVSLYDHFDSCLVLEYCSRGDLYEAIQDGNGPSTSQDIKDMFNQILSALEYCHSRGVYHRDLKPENILITEDWSIKLCDWGLATTTKIVSDKREFEIGSERYMAPELFDHTIESYDASKVDIWSVGIILLTVVFHKNPFQVANSSDKRFLQFVSNREALFDFFSSMSYDMFLILRYSLNIDPSNRDLSNLKYELDKMKYFTIDEEYWGSEGDDEEKEDYEFEFEDEDEMNTDGEVFFKPQAGLNLSPIRASIMEKLEGVNFNACQTLEPVKTAVNATAMMSNSNTPTSSTSDMNELLTEKTDSKVNIPSVPHVMLLPPSMANVPKLATQANESNADTEIRKNSSFLQSGITTPPTASTVGDVSTVNITGDITTEDHSNEFIKVVPTSQTKEGTPTTSEGEAHASMSKSSANNLDEVSVPPHNRRADALLSDNTNLKPIPIGGVHAKFRNTRKPFGVASYNAQANAGSRIVGASVPPNSASSYSRFNREDFFTPKSVANLYLDKYHGYRQNGHSEWKPAPRVDGNNYQPRTKHNWKKSKPYNGYGHHANGHGHGHGHSHSHNHHGSSYGGGNNNNNNMINGGGAGAGGGNGYGKNRARQYSKHNNGNPGGVVGSASSTYQSPSYQFKRKSITSAHGGSVPQSNYMAGIAGQSPSTGGVVGSMNANKAGRKNSVPVAQSPLGPGNPVTSNPSSLATSSGKYVPPFLRSPNYIKSPNIGPLTEEIDNLSLDDEVFHLEEDFEDSGAPSTRSTGVNGSTHTGNESLYPMTLNSNNNPRRIAFKSPLYAAMSADYNSSASSSQRSLGSNGKTASQIAPPSSANATVSNPVPSATTSEHTRRHSTGVAHMNSGSVKQQLLHPQELQPIICRPVSVGPNGSQYNDNTVSSYGSSSNTTGKYVPPYRRGSHTGAMVGVGGTCSSGYQNVNSSASSLPVEGFESSIHRSKCINRTDHSALRVQQPSTQPHENIHLHQPVHISHGSSQSLSVSGIPHNDHHHEIQKCINASDAQGMFAKKFQWEVSGKRNWSDYDD